MLGGENMNMGARLDVAIAEDTAEAMELIAVDPSEAFSRLRGISYLVGLISIVSSKSLEERQQELLDEFMAGFVEQFDGLLEGLSYDKEG